MKGIVNPEIILDHVIAYTIGTGEIMIESLEKIHNTSLYTMAIVPYGPSFYTAILQAAGVLAIKKDNKSAILIYQQDKKSDFILLYDQDIGPILGKTFTFPNFLKKLPTSLSHFVQCIQGTELLENIQNQLYFIRTLSEVEQVVIVGIGKEVEQKKVNIFLERIHKKISDFNIFFVHNFSQDIELEQGRKEDNKMFENIVNYQITKNKDNKYQIPKIFSEYSKKLKKKPIIIGYTNTGDLGGNKQKTNGYACIVA